MPENIFYIQSRAAFHKKLDHFLVASPGGLMQRRRMRMAADRVVAVGIFARIQQHANDLDMTILRSQGQRQMAVVTTRRRKEPMEVVDAPQSGRNRQIDPRLSLDQSLHRVHLAVQGCCVESAVGIRSTITEEIDQWKLQVAFARHTAGGDEHECFVQFGRLRASLENHLSDINNVRGELAVTNRIFGDELQQRWIIEVVPAFERDVLMHQLGMPLQISAQSCHVPGIDKIHGASKNGVFNSFMVGQIQLIGERGFFDMPFQARPSWEIRTRGQW